MHRTIDFLTGPGQKALQQASSLIGLRPRAGNLRTLGSRGPSVGGFVMALFATAQHFEWLS